MPHVQDTLLAEAEQWVAQMPPGLVREVVERGMAGMAAKRDPNPPTTLKAFRKSLSSAAVRHADALQPPTAGGSHGNQPHYSPIRARYQEPPHGGNPADYVAWALEVPNVTRAWCYPRLNGNGTVDVTFVCDGRADIIPTLGDVAAVQTHIDEVRPATADVTAFAPTPVPLDPSIRLNPDSPEVRAAVLAELNDFIRREAIPAGTTRVSRLREAISSAAGETYHDLVSPADDVDLPAGQIQTLGDVTWLA